MKKRILSVLLALVLLLSAVPFAFGAMEADWRTYVEEKGTTLNLYTVLPAAYVTVSDDPQILVYFEGQDAPAVAHATAVPIDYLEYEKAEDVLLLTATLTGVDTDKEDHVVIPANTVFDKNGVGNAQHSSNEFWLFNRTAEIGALDQLLDAHYGIADKGSTIAVGDTLTVYYSDILPADIYVDGKLVHHLSAGDYQIYETKVNATGTIDIAVRRGDKDLVSYHITIISSEEMYRRNVRDAFRIDFSLKDFIDAGNHGFPIFNPFVYPLVVLFGIGSILHVLFSFTRIIR